MTLPRGYDEWRLRGPDEYRTAGEEREAEVMSELEDLRAAVDKMDPVLRGCLDYFEYIEAHLTAGEDELELIREIKGALK